MDDDLTQPLPRPTFDLVAKVRRMGKSKLYNVQLFRNIRAQADKPVFIGDIVFRDDEWAQLVPGLRKADVVIEYDLPEVKVD